MEIQNKKTRGQEACVKVERLLLEEKEKERCIIYLFTLSLSKLSVSRLSWLLNGEAHQQERVEGIKSVNFPLITQGSFKATLKGKETCGCGTAEHMASALVENLKGGTVLAPVASLALTCCQGCSGPTLSGAHLPSAIPGSIALCPFPLAMEHDCVIGAVKERREQKHPGGSH